jgi:hypothetical protein
MKMQVQVQTPQDPRKRNEKKKKRIKARQKKKNAKQDTHELHWTICSCPVPNSTPFRIFAAVGPKNDSAPTILLHCLLRKDETYKNLVIPCKAKYFRLSL